MDHASGISTEYYKVFYYVGRLGSITAAAEALCISQPAASQAIKQLESELGFPLLERSSRGITFTSRGTEFLHDAYSLIKQFHTMQDHYLQTEPQGMITMSITSRYYIFSHEQNSKRVVIAMVSGHG